jgi:hypothetical protein
MLDRRRPGRKRGRGPAALDPNSLLNLWVSAIRLGDLGRIDEALRRMSRAVELTQRATLMLAMYARLLALGGQREQALDSRAEGFSARYA